jgi:hypothetical protein
MTVLHSDVEAARLKLVLTHQDVILVTTVRIENLVKDPMLVIAPNETDRENVLLVTVLQITVEDLTRLGSLNASLCHRG